jgi:hypothetical protein
VKRAHKKATKALKKKVNKTISGLSGEGGEVLINRSTYQVKPFYLSSETVLPIK